jgi:hypothetical protein
MFSSNSRDVMEGLGYSATVALELHWNGEVIDVAATRHDRIILRESRELPAGPAELTVIVDGRRTTQAIMLEATNGPSTAVAYR